MENILYTQYGTSKTLNDKYFYYIHYVLILKSMDM